MHALSIRSVLKWLTMGGLARSLIAKGCEVTRWKWSQWKWMWNIVNRMLASRIGKCVVFTCLRCGIWDFSLINYSVANFLYSGGGGELVKDGCRGCTQGEYKAQTADVSRKHAKPCSLCPDIFSNIPTKHTQDHDHDSRLPHPLAPQWRI